MIEIIQESLEALNVKCKLSPLPEAAEDQKQENSRANGVIKLRIGGFDRRKQKFKGWVEVEKFSYRGITGSFCLMKRDEVGFLLLPHFFLCELMWGQGNPICWRQLWKALIKSPAVDPHVLRK